MSNFILFFLSFLLPLTGNVLASKHKKEIPGMVDKNDVEQNVLARFEEFKKWLKVNPNISALKENLDFIKNPLASNLASFAYGGPKKGGPLVCLIDAKKDSVFYSANSDEDGEDVTKNLKVQHLIHALRKSASHTARINVGGNMVAMVYGKKALGIKEKKKILCYIVYEKRR
jgi:hypothetical protein